MSGRTTEASDFTPQRLTLNESTSGCRQCVRWGSEITGGRQFELGTSETRLTCSPFLMLWRQTEP